MTFILMWEFLLLYNRSLFWHCPAKSSYSLWAAWKKSLFFHTQNTQCLLSQPMILSHSVEPVYLSVNWIYEKKNPCMFWSLIQSQCITLNSYLGDLSSVVVLSFSGFLLCWNTATYMAWNIIFSNLAHYFSGRRFEKYCIHTRPEGKC